MRTAQPDHQDIAVLLDEVAGFAASRIAPLTARADQTIDADTLATHSHEAAALASRPTIHGSEGHRVWQRTSHANAIAFNIFALVHIASANAGVAMAWHRAALAQAMCRMIGLPIDQASPLATTVATSGHIGLARCALA